MKLPCFRPFSFSIPSCGRYHVLLFLAILLSCDPAIFVSLRSVYDLNVKFSFLFSQSYSSFYRSHPLYVLLGYDCACLAKSVCPLFICFPFPSVFFISTCARPAKSFLFPSVSPFPCVRVLIVDISLAKSIAMFIPFFFSVSFSHSYPNVLVLQRVSASHSFSFSPFLHFSISFFSFFS